MSKFDVVTFGETMIRLSPPGHGRLEAVDTLDFRTGGSESNTAIALARLGRQVAWWSKLPNNPLGRKIATQVGRWGVDTSHVIWTPHGRAGVYFIELGVMPRRHEVYYDRADSAASTLSPSEVDWSHLEQARHLHLTGITSALSAGCAASVARAAQEARAKGLSVSFDTNYRRKLWPPGQAKSVISSVLPSVNLLFCPRDDADIVFGVKGTSARIARHLQQTFGVPAVVVTGSPDGVAAVDGERDLHSRNIRAMEVDRIGSGDAGNAGIIHGFLDGDLATGLRYGSAMAALKLTVPGDELIVTKQEIEAVMNCAAGGVQR